MKSNLEEQQYRYTLTKISHLEQPVTVYYKEKFLFVEWLLDLSQIMLHFFYFYDNCFLFLLLCYDYICS